VSHGLAELAIGGLIVFAGFIVTLIAIANGLAHILPPEQADWLAPLIVGVVVMIVGYIVLSRGRKQLQAENLAPERTMESLQRNATLAKEHAK
jgi:xanthine/uracil permease